MSELIALENFKNKKIYPIYTGLYQALEKLQQEVPSLGSVGAPYDADVEKIINGIKALEGMVQKLAEAEQTEEPTYWSKLRHDTTTPVNAIKGYSELLEEDLADKQPDVATHLKAILQITKEVLTAISKLRLEHFNAELKEEPPPPLVTQEEKITPLPMNTKPRPTVEGHILVVDDNENNRQLLQQRLQREGHTVIVAEGGIAALQTVNAQRVDVILLDLMMPDISGYEVLCRLKNDEQKRGIPVIMISAISEIDQIAQCIEAGAEDYLPKPFNPVLLRARIGACLEKKRWQQREQEYAQKISNVQQLLTSAIESMDHGFAIYNAQHLIVMFNKTFQSFYPQVMIGDSITQFYERHLQGTWYDQGEITPEEWLLRRLKLWETKSSITYEDKLKDGRMIQINLYSTPDGSRVAIHKDITNQHAEEERLAYLAYHDNLTGLKNRKAFNEALQTLAPGDEAAILYMDLDGFKKINDTWGHEFGDAVLKYVAQRLTKAVRQGDLVARLGGDEFCVFLGQVSDPTKIKEVIERVLQSVGTSYQEDNKVGTFGMSIGCAIFPKDATTAEAILTNADIAMYAAKKAGKGTYRFYSDLPK